MRSWCQLRREASQRQERHAINHNTRRGNNAEAYQVRGRMCNQVQALQQYAVRSFKLLGESSIMQRGRERESTRR